MRRPPPALEQKAKDSLKVEHLLVQASKHDRPAARTDSKILSQSSKKSPVSVVSAEAPPQTNLYSRDSLRVQNSLDWRVVQVLNSLNYHLIQDLGSVPEVPILRLPFASRV